MRVVHRIPNGAKPGTGNSFQVQDNQKRPLSERSILYLLPQEKVPNAAKPRFKMRSVRNAAERS